jgi:hypothetical protein
MPAGCSHPLEEQVGAQGEQVGDAHPVELVDVGALVEAVGDELAATLLSSCVVVEDGGDHRTASVVRPSWKTRRMGRRRNRMRRATVRLADRLGPGCAAETMVGAAVLSMRRPPGDCAARSELDRRR